MSLTFKQRQENELKQKLRRAQNDPELDNIVEAITALDIKTNTATRNLATMQSELSNLTIETDEHLVSAMPHQVKDLQSTKTFRFGLQMSADGQPQIKFEEVL